MTNRAPKYSKIELLLNTEGSVEKLEFLDCGLMITGDYLVVIIDEQDEMKTTLTSTGKIFHMAKIKTYKTHAS
jgi:hypothetical protein